MMTDLEELKKDKEKLLLERDIARLIRHKRIANWSYVWVIPIAIFGAVSFFASLSDKTPAGMFIGVILFAPLALKILVMMRS